MFEEMEIHPKIQSAVLRHPDAKSGPFEFRFSSVGICERRADYQIEDDRRGVKQEVDTRTAFRFAVGSALHELWQNLMKWEYGDDFTDIEQTLHYEDDVLCGGYAMTGHIDGYIKSLDAVYELKTVSESSYAMVTRDDKPIREHVEQANFYAWVKGTSQFLLHYFNKNSHESKLFLIPMNEGMAKGSVEKMRGISKRADSGELAPRPYTDPTASPCWYCPYKTACYATFEQEVMSGSALEVDPDEPVADAMLLADAERTKRLVATKAEEEYKKQVADYMVRNQATELQNVHSKIAALIKLGKNNNPIITIKEMK